MIFLRFTVQFRATIKTFFSLPFLPLIFAPIILLSPVVLTGKALFWGTPSLQFLPWWKWAFDTLLTGQLPLWNPLVGMGAPLIANYQSALFYPPNWTYFLFYVLGGISALAWSQALMGALHLIWASIGTALLVRRLGLGRLAQTISGLAFGLSGYLVARAWFASINAAVAWLPWVLLLAYDLVVQNRTAKSILKLGLVVGLQLLTGHAQTTWYTWVLAALWVGFWSWQTLDESDTNSLPRKVLKIQNLFRNWKVINQHAKKLTAIWSKDDPTVDEAHIRKIEEETDTEVEITDGYGHFLDKTCNLILEKF